MRTITIVLLSASLAALSSCAKKNASSSTAYPIDLPGNAKAYIAGTSGDTAVYYVNGKEYTLTSGADSAAATAITVSGSDVYVAGYELDGGTKVAKYWKNGVATILSNTVENTVANAIVVVGSNVYVAGTITEGPFSTAVFWKNGTMLLLTTPGRNGAANAICSNGVDIYIAGYDSTAGRVAACYWKNGDLTTLPDSLAYSVAQGITLSGSDVYVAGWDVSADGFSLRAPRLWKNGTPIPLSTTSPAAAATSITVVGNDIYLAGQDYYRSVYWKNGTETFMDGYKLNAIAISNGDLYFAGQAGNASPDGFATGVFWRDGIIFNIGTAPGSANAIVVTN